MGIENFIEDALYKPNDYIAYHVARELAELHPQKSVIQGSTWYFDLEQFSRAGHCSVVEQKSIFHHSRTEWESGKKLYEKIQNSWLNVLWQGHLIDVVLITWYDGRSGSGTTGSWPRKEK
jgi:excinuclease UvrABC helicase subunit UvrB